MPEVDAAIEALLSGDAHEVIPFLAFETVACSTDGASGSVPPCPSGTNDKTPVEVVPYNLCQGTFLFKADAQAALSKLLAGSPTLYAVYRETPAAGTTTGSPKGSYVVVIESSQAGGPTKLGYAFHVEGGKVIFIDLACARAAQDVVASVPSAAFLVPPP